MIALAIQKITEDNRLKKQREEAKKIEEKKEKAAIERAALEVENYSDKKSVSKSPFGLNILGRGHTDNDLHQAQIKSVDAKLDHVLSLLKQ